MFVAADCSHVGEGLGLLDRLRPHLPADPPTIAGTAYLPFSWQGRMKYGDNELMDIQ